MENTVIDLIVRIKNGYMARRDTVQSPYSIYREEVLKKLVQVGLIQDYTVSGEIVKTILITLIYKDGQPALTDVVLYSKPGRRYYVSYKDLKPVLGGLGYGILSTPKGILTNYEAKKQKVGGELLFNVW